LKNKILAASLSTFFLILISVTPLHQIQAMVGLGVTGPNPINIIDIRGNKILHSYVRVINDGGNQTGFYNITVSGNLTQDGWKVTFNPAQFWLEPNEQKYVDVAIYCLDINETRTATITVSAYTAPNATGVSTQKINVSVTLTNAPPPQLPPPDLLLSSIFYGIMALELGVIVLWIFILVYARCRNSKSHPKAG
jgi:hypothetical protein